MRSLRWQWQTVSELTSDHMCIVHKALTTAVQNRIQDLKLLSGILV